MVAPLTMAERVALRYARGVTPGPNQIRSIQRVLADLDRAKIYMDFDLLSDLFSELSRSPLVSGTAAEQAKSLASRLAEIHRYTISYVLNTMSDVNNFISGGLSLPPGPAHPRGVFASPP